MQQQARFELDSRCFSVRTKNVSEDDKWKHLMLLVPQTAAAASKVLLVWSGIPVLSFRSWSYSAYVVVSVGFIRILRRGARHRFFFFFNFVCLFVSVVFSLCQRVWISSICTSYLSYPVRWHVIALSTLLATMKYLCVVVS